MTIAHPDKYIFDTSSQVWLKPEQLDFSYSDGEAIEKRIHQIIKNTQDVSTGSDELTQKICDWPTEYHFSANRHNLLRPFHFRPDEKILELGSGCGAITRQLGETNATVVAVEGSIKRAKITAERCRDLPNVHVYCDNLIEFDTVEKFDTVTLIGVLEYSRMFIKTDCPELSCLKKALGYLKEGGRLILAIENKFGLKYFNGASEDHTGVFFYGIHDLYEKNTAATFGKNELTELLNSAGFNQTEFYYPFPDYKIPTLVLSENGLNTPELNLGNLLLKSSGRDYINYRPRSFHEGLVWGALAKNRLIDQMSNSFLVIARAQETAQNVEWLSKHYNTSRIKPWMKESTINKQLDITQNFVYPACAKKSNEKFSISFPNQDKYHHGDLYLTALIKDTMRGRDLNQIVAWVRPWLDFLISKAIPNAQEQNVLRLKLPNNYVDCIPHNLIQGVDGQLYYFDDEWKSNEAEIPLSWVLIRGLHWSFTHLVVIDTPLMQEKTYYHFIQKIFSQLGLNYDKTVFEEAVVWEDNLMKSAFKSTPVCFKHQLNALMKSYLYTEALDTSSFFVRKVKKVLKRLKKNLKNEL